MSANGKVSLKNQDLSSLLSIGKEAIIIPKISGLLPSVFYIPSLVFQILRLSFLIKLGCITLIVLSKLIRALIEYCPN